MTGNLLGCQVIQLHLTYAGIITPSWYRPVYASFGCTLPIQVSPTSPQEASQNAKKKSETPWEFRFCLM